MSYKRKIIGTSLEEIRFFYFIRKIFPDVKNKYPFKHKYTKNAELDIFVPHLNFAIEYDGVYYHSSDKMIQKDLNKNKACEESNITILRIREKGLTALSFNDIIYDYNKKGSHKECCQKISEFIKKDFALSQKELDYIENLDYNSFEIGPEILKLYDEIEESISLLVKNPNLCKEWNYEKNNGLEPNKIRPNSDLLVWWKCAVCEHEWQETIHNRHRGTLGCSRCRSLGVKRPEIAKEWHPTKNGNSTPFDFTIGSNKVVWWLCTKGTEYQMSIDERRRLKSCTCHAYNTHNLHDCNNLAYINPELSKQWHQTKNNGITPKDIFPATTSIKYWWICDKGHEYKSTPHQRHHLKQGCPYCDGKKVNSDNCLATKNPKLASYWNYNKNAELTPEKITISSGKKVWWKCSACDNEWEGFVNNLNRAVKICKHCKI